MHLARHLKTTHKARTAATSRRQGGRMKARRATVARRSTRRAKGGRPTGVVARLGLRALGIEQLTEVIHAARQEARRRLAEVQASIR
jgi:uncharacterized protein GlcG (DUF336 family)